MEGLTAGVAGEVLVLGVALLVCPQGGVAAETLQTALTAVGLSSGGSGSTRQTSDLMLVFVVVDKLLVLLQLAVVEKGLSTEVTHEGFLHAVNQHVCLQSPGTREALSTFITPKSGTNNVLQSGLNTHTNPPNTIQGAGIINCS